MKRLLPLLLLQLACISLSFGQVVIDFESESTSLNFQYFGGSAEGAQSNTIANPNPSGINTSGTVLEWVKVGDAPVWGGGFANPAPAIPIDATNGGQVCIKAHFDHIGNLTLKLEASTTGGPNWVTSVANTTTGEWEEICFDLTANSIEDPFTPASGHIYGQIVLFADFGVEGTGENVVTYIDDITYTGPSERSCTSILDFETEATSTDFQIFGSSLDGQLTTIIDNPNSSGINTSGSVVEYIKAADAQTWGGMFSNPDPSTPVDASAGGEICVKVHMDHIGNLAVKLEQPNEGENWITTVENTKINEWEELCFNFDNPSLEDSNQPATGRVFGRIVLFFDFGTAGTGADQTFYFDDIQVCTSNQTEIVDVTFSVDMNEYGTDNFGTVYISGDFNGWAGDANALSDEDGDGVWTTTIPLPTGPIEYKFTLDNWSAQEMFNGSEACTKLTVNDDGRFVNRSLVITADSDPGTVCFNSCYACGESVKITFDLGVSAITPAESGVFLAGGLEFGAPNEKFRLMPSTDGVVSLTIERPIGFSGYYTFTNGACGDFSCKENIAGQDCANPDNFNDRFINPVMADTTIATCFGQCTVDTNCGPALSSGMISFAVDMNGYTETIGTVYVSGSFNSWSGDSNPLADEDGDGVWEGTFELPGGDHEFKFTIDNWAVQEGFVPEDPCTVTSGGFTNRALTVDGDASVCFPWNSCESCLVNTNDLVINPNLVRINPNLVRDFAQLTFEPQVGRKQVELWDLNGKLIWQRAIDRGQDQLNLDLSSYQSGIYLVRVRTDEMIVTKRMIKQ